MKDFHEILPFDLVLLGMGKDGHFASIFPDMVRDKRFIGLEEPPQIYKISQRGDPFVPRITMNLSLILNSKLIFLCISSVEKKIILEKSKQETKYPVHWLLNQKKTVVKIEMGYTSHG